MIDSNPSINFAEEFSSKIPALTLLTALGYEFIPPSQCPAMNLGLQAANEALYNAMLYGVIQCLVCRL